MRSLGTFVKRFGAFEGCSLFFRFRYGKTNSLQLRELKHPLRVMPGTLDHASFEEIFLDGEYDIPYPRFETAKLHILDAGANTGFASIFFANKFPDSEIVAIEPEDSNILRLRENVAPYKQVKIVDGAVWFEDTHLDLRDEGWGTRGFMVGQSTDNEMNKVAAFSIDSLMQQAGWNRIHILKMDVEGSEKEIFEKNYANWLPKTQCLIVETHDRMKEGCTDALNAAMKNFNFSSFAQGENLIFVNQNWGEAPM